MKIKSIFVLKLLVVFFLGCAYTPNLNRAFLADDRNLAKRNCYVCHAPGIRFEGVISMKEMLEEGASGKMLYSKLQTEFNTKSKKRNLYHQDVRRLSPKEVEALVIFIKRLNYL